MLGDSVQTVSTSFNSVGRHYNAYRLWDYAEISMDTSMNTTSGARARIQHCWVFRLNARKFVNLATYAPVITKQNKCWACWLESLKNFKPRETTSSNCQQLTATYNRVFKGTGTILGPTMLRALARRGPDVVTR